MIIESLFDGMSCAYIAAERAGLNITKYYASEVDKYATKVSENNYPNIIRLGDVTKWREWEHKEVDLLTAGSPCQGFSAAGKQGGTKAILEGMEIIVSTLEQYEEVKSKGAEFLSQSHLFWEFVSRLRYLQSIGQAKYFMLENVIMSKENNEMITRALGVEPIEINSNLFLPQNRRRLYWTNINFDKFIHDKRTLDFQDILENGYTNKKNSSCLLEGHSRPNKDSLRLVRRDLEKSLMPLVYNSKEDYDIILKHYKENYKGKTAKEVDEIRSNLDNSVYDCARILNANEMEKLQGVPVGYTKSVSRNRAASMLGNGWTVDVIAHILKGLKGD